MLKSQEDNVKLKSERDRMNNRIYELQEERDNFAYKEKDCQQQITILNNRMQNILNDNKNMKKEIQETNLNLSKVTEERDFLGDEKSSSEWSSTLHSKLELQYNLLKGQNKNLRAKCFKYLLNDRQRILSMYYTSWYTSIKKSISFKKKQISIIRNVCLRLIKGFLLKVMRRWKFVVNESVLDEVRRKSLQKELDTKASHANEINVLKNDYANKYKATEDSHRLAIEALEVEYEVAVKKLTNQHVRAFNLMTNENASKLDNYSKDTELLLENAKKEKSIIESKFQTTMDKLRRKYYKYWTNLNKSRILRIWRENVLSLRLQRNRDKSVSRIFTNYNHIRRKYSFSRWYKYSQKRKYKRVLCSHIFGNHFRRQLFLSFHFWHRQSVRDQHQAIHNKKQLMIAISTWRQLKKKKTAKADSSLERFCFQ